MIDNILYISASKNYISGFISGRYIKLTDDDVQFLLLIGYTFDIYCGGEV